VLSQAGKREGASEAIRESSSSPAARDGLAGRQAKRWRNVRKVRGARVLRRCGAI